MSAITSAGTAAAASAEPAPAILEAVGLAKHFPVRARRMRARGTVRAAEDITLALRAGKVTAIVGESGSGKSTISRLLARVTEPTAGRILFDGTEVDLRRGATRDYRARVQLVLQDPFASLNPVHRVRYILGRPLKIHHHRGANIDDTIKDLLRRVSLEPADQFIDKYPHELSGGQRQRVAIARALAAQPKVLLADEPVSMLDVSIRLGVLNLLADLRDREGLAIMYVTHDIASARYLADTIAVMYAGRIIEIGPADDIANNPTHPYTQLLLSAAPDPDASNSTWQGARGAPPSLVNPPNGCRFHPRCPYAMAKCAVETPPAFSVTPHHVSNCWLHEPGAGAPSEPSKLAEPATDNEPDDVTP